MKFTKYFLLLLFILFNNAIFAQTRNNNISLNYSIVKFPDWLRWKTIYSLSYIHTFNQVSLSSDLAYSYSQAIYNDLIVDTTANPHGKIVGRVYAYSNTNLGYYLFQSKRYNLNVSAGPSFLFRNETRIGSIYFYEAMLYHTLKFSCGANISVLNELSFLKRWNFNIGAKYQFYTYGKSFISLNAGIGFNF